MDPLPRMLKRRGHDEAVKGIINIDDRDSTPDWKPYLQPVAPEGAPSVLNIVLDDVGFSAALELHLDLRRAEVIVRTQADVTGVSVHPSPGREETWASEPSIRTEPFRSPM